MEKLYKVFCFYTSPKNGDNAISELDAEPGYLHIHAIAATELNKIKSESSSLKELKEDIAKSPGTLYQWGVPIDKTNKTRRPVTNVETVMKYGNIGVGSAAIGEEKKGEYIGGGEAFISDNLAFRITKGKGGHVFKMDEKDTYWIVQVTDLTNAHISSDLAGKEINGRDKLKQELLKILSSQNKLEDKPFVAVFDAIFDKETTYMRSNGIFPQDDVKENERDISLFSASSPQKGGHVIGDSLNPGDNINIHKQDPAEKNLIDPHLRLTIKGNVSIQPINKVKIAKTNNPEEFRDPYYKKGIDALKSLIQKRQKNSKYIGR